MDSATANTHAYQQSEFRPPLDPYEVNLDERRDIDYWTRRFDCSEERLRAAVKQAGVMAVDVGRELRRWSR